ncbi:MAG: DUF3106 domain-containing protein [Herminiimonas sp.]|nr:DUF3106 domain-containing protein [Herminiimonas sp.]
MTADGAPLPAARASRAACISRRVSISSIVVLLTSWLFYAMTVPAVAQGTTANVAPATAVKVTPKQGSAGPLWKDLLPIQQQALSPLATEWDKLDATHKSKWLTMSKKFVSMKPEDQARIQERMRAWVALTPDQRRVARESYARTKKLNTDQKSAQWEQYQQLPEEQKKKLAAEAAKNKVATPPSSQSKVKVVPTLKSATKPVLQESVHPHAGATHGEPAAAVTPPSAAPSPLPAAPTAPAEK